MVKVKITPLWCVEKTEKWLHHMYDAGYCLSRTCLCLYYFEKKNRKNLRYDRYFLHFFQRGDDDLFSFQWEESFCAKEVPSFLSFYFIEKYANTVDKEKELTMWHNRRRGRIKTAILERIGVGILLIIVLPLFLGTRFSWGLAIAGGILSCAYLIYNIIGLVCILRMLRKA